MLLVVVVAVAVAPHACMIISIMQCELDRT